MKNDQIVRPALMSNTPVYEPKEIHTYFKTRGSEAWNRSYKSKVKTMRGSLASREFSKSRMPETYHGPDQEKRQLFPSRSQFFTTAKKSKISKKRRGKSKSSR